MSAAEPLAGERTVAQVIQAQSRAVRVQRRLALILVVVVGAAILGWYYLHVAERSRAEPSTVRNSIKAAVASEMKLPPLRGRLAAPRTPAADTVSERAPPPADTVAAPGTGSGTVAALTPSTDSGASQRGGTGSAHTAARAASPVMLRPSSAETAGSAATTGFNSLAALTSLAAAQSHAGSPEPTDSPARGAGALADSLVLTTTPAVEAQLLPTRRWLLPKGSFLDCTLETAIDSTLPGMTTCMLAVDVYGADGRVVLFERGTKLVGETRADVRPGQARVAVVWSEARTPTGVVVALASPGTDAVGRAGVPGSVDTHFAARFGAAMMLSLIDGAVSAVVSHQQGSASVIYSAQGSKDIATETLHNTIAIPPTITVAPGARIQVLVARDIDFRGVYRLKPLGQR